MLPETYEDWLALTDAEKTAVKEQWDAYEGDGYGFVLCAAGRLVIADDCKIEQATPGIYHFGIWVISAYVSEEDCAKKPPPFEQEFEGFPIWWGHRKPPRSGDGTPADPQKTIH